MRILMHKVLSPNANEIHQILQTHSLISTLSYINNKPKWKLRKSIDPQIHPLIDLIMTQYLNLCIIFHKSIILLIHTSKSNNISGSHKYSTDLNIL